MSGPSDTLVVTMPRDLHEWLRNEVVGELQFLNSQAVPVLTQTTRLLKALNEAAAMSTEGALCTQILKGATELGDMIDAGVFVELPAGRRNEMQHLQLLMMCWAVRSRLQAIAVRQEKTAAVVPLVR